MWYQGFQQFCKVAVIFLKAPDVSTGRGMENDRTKRPASGLKRTPVFTYLFKPFLTSECAKRNEQVIGDDGEFTYSLARSDTHM